MTVAMLAIAVPVLIVIAYLGLRRAQSTPMVRSLSLAKGTDTRGIALQTVIIIVVLLAIAGAVAAVLLSTGAEVASDLEGSDITGTIDTSQECAGHTMGTKAGTWTNAQGSDPAKCVWKDAAVTNTQCRLVNGIFDGTDTCTVTVN